MPTGGSHIGPDSGPQQALSPALLVLNLPIEDLCYGCFEGGITEGTMMYVYTSSLCGKCTKLKGQIDVRRKEKEKKVLHPQISKKNVPQEEKSVLEAFTQKSCNRMYAARGLGGWGSTGWEGRKKTNMAD